MTTPPFRRPGADTALAAHDWLADRYQTLLDDLAAYVMRETPSDDKSLLDQGLHYVLSWIGDRCGEATVHPYPHETHGAVTVVDLPGPLPGPPVLILAHYDTVWPAGTLASWPFTITGGRAGGPGVYDMKAGLVQGVWAIRALDKLSRPRPPIRLLLSGDEEIGSPASRQVIEEQAAGCRACLVLEPSAAGGDLKVARKGVADFDITATGIEAHAGLEPELGASAVTAIAHAVLAVADLADPRRGTTLNAGGVTGGSRRNVVAGEAAAHIDVRVSDRAEADRVESALRALSPPDPRVRLTVSGGWNRPVFARNDATDSLFRRAQRIGAALGIPFAATQVGGASDGNFVVPLGVPVLDGLGAVGDGAHACHEYIETDTLVQRTALLAGLLTELAGRTETPATHSPAHHTVARARNEGVTNTGT
ncbi:M20 family metallopeptidase [Streptomyces sp. NPDC051133]|uniref:M20 family metallopeptidase n=1 Tax=Streptomyces sp. NPDC051133 TaxID=3155521 RepID=UPI003417854D